LGVATSQRFAALWKLGELLPEASPGGDVTVSVGLKDGKGLRASKPAAAPRMAEKRGDLGKISRYYG